MSKNEAKRIIVEQSHIDGALPEVSSKCMVADAIRDAIPGCTKRHVDMQTLRFTDANDVRRVYLTPSSVQAALVRFDAGDPVSPFAFNLPKPIQVVRPEKRPKKKARVSEVTTSSQPPVRIGGRPTPVIRTLTRRRFGIRGLRINQEGKVVQTGTDASS